MTHKGELPFIARDQSLGAIGSHLSGIRAGRAGLVLITGEPGIGKSRLLREALLLWPGRVLSAVGDEFAQSRPFGMLLDAFGCRISSADPALARIARRVAESASEYQVVDDLVELVESSLLAEPLLLSLDDLQWADPSTLTGLRFLLRHLPDLPLGFIAATRPVPRRRELDAFVEMEQTLLVDLEPFDEAGSVELASAALGGTLPLHLVEMVRKAGGNPFYVTELVSAWADSESAGGQEASRDSLPTLLQLSLRRYLRFLSPESLQLLRIATVLGNGFAVEDLAAAAGTDVRSAVVVVDEAVDAGILATADEKLVYRHDLLREALYADIPLAARKALHRLVANTLHQRGADPTVIAEHILASGSPVSNDEISSLLGAATGIPNVGQRADLLRRALHVVPRIHEMRPHFVAAAVEAFSLAGLGDEADDLARAEAIGPDTTVRMAWLRSLSNRSLPVQFFEQLELLGEAQISPDDRSELWGLESAQRLLTGDLAAAAFAAERATGTPDGTGNGAIFGLQTLAMLAMLEGRSRDAVGLAQQAVLRQRPGPVASHMFLAAALFSDDRFEEVDACVREGDRLARESGLINVLPLYFGVLGATRLEQGLLDEADAAAETMSDFLAESGAAYAPFAEGLRSSVALCRGDLETARARAKAGMDSIVAPAMGVDFAILASAQVDQAGGATGSAFETMKQVWIGMPAFRHSWTFGPRAIELVNLAIAHGESDLARDVAGVLETAAAGGSSPTALGAARLAQALVERNHELARQAAEIYATGPRLLSSARAKELAGELAADLSDKEPAVNSLRAASAEYGRIGAAGCVARVDRTLRRLGVRPGARGPRRRPSSGWDSLTPSELQVVGLVVEGMTTRRVAERLFVSINTVETHLRNTYRKLGIGSRVELTALALKMRH